MSKEQQQEIRDLIADCKRLQDEIACNLVHAIEALDCERYYIDEELIPDHDILEEYAIC